MSLTVFLVLNAFVLLIAAVVIMHRQMSPQHPLRQMLETEAQEREGRVYGGFYPHLEFMLMDLLVSVWISARGKNTPEYVSIETTWITPQDVPFSVFPENAVTVAGKNFGIDDIEVHDPEFDAAYCVTGQDHRRIRELLDRDVQQFLLSLKDKSPKLEVDLKSFRLVIPSLPRADAELKEQIDAAVGIITRLKEVMVNA